jgi:hypothetical protein
VHDLLINVTTISLFCISGHRNNPAREFKEAIYVMIWQLPWDLIDISENPYLKEAQLVT